ncbi:MAG TPA: ABC transporter ATP-binding protein [Ktedonobacterales bacterium]
MTSEALGAQGPNTETTSAAPGAAGPLVAVCNLVKTFGHGRHATRALDDVTFDISAGETFGMVGPNGSGKTTLIRILLGIARATSGEARVLGRVMPDRRVAKGIGYMSQASALYSDLSVNENLAFFGRLYGLRGATLKQRIDESLSLVDLSDRRGSVVGALSGGMRQRVSLAIALIHEPKLLFLDEPTVGIDPELRVEFWDYFSTLNARGVTILVSTHHLDEARRCHRLALLRFGRLLALDTPDALLAASGQADFDHAFLYFAHRQEPGESTSLAG